MHDHNETLREALARNVRDALFEDIGRGDWTAQLVPAGRRVRARVVAKQAAVICGRPWFDACVRALDAHAQVDWPLAEGAEVVAGDEVCVIQSDARALLSAERPALNFLQTLSATATLTRQYVQAIAGTSAKILDTRKTTPGLRHLEKYAVRCGRGRNHRMDLSAMAMLKDNHLAAVGGDIVAAVAAVRATMPDDTWVEVETDRIEQVERAIESGANVIMLDNMSLDMMRTCVQLVAGRAIVEASGGVTLDRVRSIAETGVDWISVGALTHSAPALDLGLDFA